MGKKTFMCYLNEVDETEDNFVHRSDRKKEKCE